ncbi:RND family transporter [Motiliproteus sp. MSK22-1]|uniref:efflux RND transporter permease subunit n=1 Tax=Motiliproteus sp. MSK22-1 TaxID=1897630 RepID=UPI0009763CD7|nr:MMPL family transporter [Motiliproteus sp. MSK22-1]OMH29120.1 hypothetical protein BGP75_20425 [Motiliproteus sp. MSK22-1]
MKSSSAINHVITSVLTSIFNHRIKSAILLLIFTALYAGSQLPNLQRDGRIEAFMRSDDPALLHYYELRKQFGQDNRIVITISADNIFTTEFMNQLGKFHREVADGVPYVSEIFSLYNIPFIEYDNGSFYLEELMRNVLNNGENPASLQERITSTPLYKNFVIDKEGKSAAIIVEPYRYAPSPSDCIAIPSEGISCPAEETISEERQPLGSPQYIEMTHAAQQIAEKYQQQDFDIHISGAPVVSSEIVRLMSKDMPRFTLASVAIALLFMAIVFRSTIISAGALIGFLSSLFTTLASMSLTNTPLTPPTQLLIALGLVINLCVYIHFMNTCVRLSRQDIPRHEIFKQAIGSIHHPIFFSVLTSAGGLIGFTTSSLAPIAALGAFGAVITLASYVFALCWASVAFALLPKRFFLKKRRYFNGIAYSLAQLSGFAAQNPKRVLMGFAIIAIASGATLVKLNYSHNSLLWLSESNPIRQSTEYIDEKFQGTVNLEVTVKPSAEHDIRNKEILEAISRAAKRTYQELDIPIGRHTSAISFIEETNQAVHEGNPAERRLPSQREIWDEFLLLESEGNDDIMRYLTLNYSQGRVSFLVPWLEAKRYAGVAEQVKSIFAEELNTLATVEVSGLITLLAQTSKAVLDNMGYNYLYAFIIITLLMCMTLGSSKFGLLSMIPNVFPFIVVLAVMAVSGIPIDTFTILIGGLLTGLIVDDTVHLFYSYRQHIQLTNDPSQAIKSAVNDVGGALLITTVIVVCSFSVFLFSSMSNIRAFGALMMIGTSLALITDLLLAPAIISITGYKQDKVINYAYKQA